MSEVKTQDIKLQTETREAIEFIELLKSLTNDEKNQVKGWGSDMISGLIDGIWSMLGAVGNAAKSVAEKITSFLHFSRPDEGPLRDYEKWMPDFVGRMAEQINQQKHLISDAAMELATNLNISGMVDSGSQGSQTTSNNTQINFNGNYNFKDKTDVDYFMNQAALKLVTER